MSPYNTCELDAPSHRFAVLMRSWYYSPKIFAADSLEIQCSEITSHSHGPRVLASH